MKLIQDNSRVRQVPCISYNHKLSTQKNATYVKVHLCHWVHWPL